MVLVNQDNFSLRIMVKSQDSVSASKNTSYNNFRICFALEGEAVWEIEDRSYEVREGDVVFLNMGQKRQFTSFGKNGFKLCILNMNRNAFSGQHHFLFFLEQIKKRGNVIRNRELFLLLKEIFEEWETESSFRYELASSKLTEFFLKLERCEGYSIQGLTENHRRILEIMDDIDANIANGITLSSVAKKAGLTESTLSRQFSKINGVSFKRYVVEKKIQRAIHLLHTTNRTIVDIASESGFDSISGFYSAFRKKTGTTPSKFDEYDV
ncbi:MAG: helix-turn-helix domain-containing protein [Clostridia bacterium]|nr:helix-turn-helix domain-containing protein [Clostridia bacterium]